MINVPKNEIEIHPVELNSFQELFELQQQQQQQHLQLQLKQKQQDDLKDEGIEVFRAKRDNLFFKKRYEIVTRNYELQQDNNNFQLVLPIENLQATIPPDFKIVENLTSISIKISNVNSDQFFSVILGCTTLTDLYIIIDETKTLRIPPDSIPQSVTNISITVDDQIREQFQFENTLVHHSIPDSVTWAKLDHMLFKHDPIGLLPSLDELLLLNFTYSHGDEIGNLFPSSIRRMDFLGTSKVTAVFEPSWFPPNLESINFGQVLNNYVFSNVETLNIPTTVTELNLGPITNDLILESIPESIRSLTVINISKKSNKRLPLSVSSSLEYLDFYQNSSSHITKELFNKSFIFHDGMLPSLKSFTIFNAGDIDFFDSSIPNSLEILNIDASTFQDHSNLFSSTFQIFTFNPP
eukprot:gene7383-9070_t